MDERTSCFSEDRVNLWTARTVLTTKPSTSGAPGGGFTVGSTLHSAQSRCVAVSKENVQRNDTLSTADALHAGVVHVRRDREAEGEHRPARQQRVFLWPSCSRYLVNVLRVGGWVSIPECHSCSALVGCVRLTVPSLRTQPGCRVPRSWSGTDGEEHN